MVLVDAGKVEGLYPPDYASVPLQAAGVAGAEIETCDYEKSIFFAVERDHKPRAAPALELGYFDVPQPGGIMRCFHTK